jgi:hypothetical protein
LVYYREVLLAYVDESSDQTTYFINSLVISDDEIIPLGNRLHELRIEICQEYTLVDDIEFHGYEILNGFGKWKSLKTNYAAQKDIFNSFLDVVLEFDVGIYIKGINKSNFESRYGTDEEILHNAALIWNLEKIQNRAQRDDDVALVIADEVGKSGAFYRSRLRFHQRSETFGWQPVILDRIADTIHFAPSSESIFIQAVDMIAHANIRARRVDSNLELSAFQSGLRDKIWRSGNLKYYDIW